MRYIRPLPALLGVALAICAGSAAAATFVAIEADPGEHLLGAPTLERSSATGALIEPWVGLHGDVRLDVRNGLRFRPFAVGFHVTRPGTYDFPHPPTGQTAPMWLEGDSDCSSPAGRLVLHRIEYDPPRSPGLPQRLRVLAADFDLACTRSPARIRGRVRFRTGDDTCTAAGEGAACDDGDPCGSDDRCHAGRCNGAPPAVCSDDDPRTEDLCRPAVGCLHPPVASRWRVTGRTRVTASVDGRSASRGTALAGDLLLFADRTYAIPNVVQGCLGAPPGGLAETGTWNVDTRGRLRLHATNVDEIVRVLDTCGPQLDGVRVAGARQWVAVAGPGRRACPWDRAVRRTLHLCGESVLRLRVRASGRTGTVAIRQRFRGTRANASAFVPPLLPPR